MGCSECCGARWWADAGWVVQGVKAVAAPFAMLARLIELLPVINRGLNEAIIRLAPQMSGQDKRNLVRAVSGPSRLIPLAVGTVAR